MAKFKRERLYRRFDVKIMPKDEEEKRLLDEVEEIINKYFIESSFFQQGDEKKVLVTSLYRLGLEYLKLKRNYTMQQIRIEKLLEELRSLYE